MFKINTEGQAFLYNLLVNSKFRIWRHILFIVSLAAISFNQTYVIFQPEIPALGTRLYWIALGNLASYLAVAYLNIYVLVPRYLMQKRYLTYTVMIFGTVLVLLWIQTIIEDTARIWLGQRAGNILEPVFILNYISSFATVTLCMLGGSITIVLKHWMTENNRVNQLERIHVQSEVEQLKAQVNPQLLFNVLNRTAVLAKSEPKEASGMLLELSQILRYQLYDCSRKAVLLKAEIDFLTNYLALEQVYSHRFQYMVSAEGEVHRIFVPPLLFLPFVQQAVIQIYSQPVFGSIDLNFHVNGNEIQFVCSFDNGNLLHPDDFSKIRQRLELLYGNDYTLSVAKRTIMLKFKIQKT